jgi:hypothetical protein
MDWPERWQPMDDAESVPFLAELLRELAQGHLLYGLPLRVVGQRVGTDDIFCLVEDGSGRVADVHLTWKRCADKPPWPSANLYKSWEAWVAAITDVSL